MTRKKEKNKTKPIDRLNLSFRPEPVLAKSGSRNPVYAKQTQFDSRLWPLLSGLFCQNKPNSLYFQPKNKVCRKNKAKSNLPGGHRVDLSRRSLVRRWKSGFIGRRRTTCAKRTQTRPATMKMQNKANLNECLINNGLLFCV